MEEEKFQTFEDLLWESMKLGAKPSKSPIKVIRKRRKKKKKNPVSKNSESASFQGLHGPLAELERRKGGIRQPGASEVVFEYPVTDPSGRRVSIIHHRAPTLETATNGIAVAITNGLGEFAQILGKGAGAIAVVLLGKRYLIGPGKKIPTTQKDLEKLSNELGVLHTLKNLVFAESPVDNGVDASKIANNDTERISMTFEILVRREDGTEEVLIIEAESEESAVAEASKVGEVISVVELELDDEDNDFDEADETDEDDYEIALADTLRLNLGLDSKASHEDIITAVSNLREFSAAFSDSDAKELAELRKSAADLAHKNRVMTWQQKLTSLKSLDNHDKRAEKLAAFEEKLGVDDATQLFNEWQHIDKVISNGLPAKTLLSGLETSSSDDPVKTFMDEVSRYSIENPSSNAADAVTFVAKQKPDLYRSYREAMRSR